MMIQLKFIAAFQSPFKHFFNLSLNYAEKKSQPAFKHIVILIFAFLTLFAIVYSVNYPTFLFFLYKLTARLSSVLTVQPKDTSTVYILSLTCALIYHANPLV